MLDVNEIQRLRNEGLSLRKIARKLRAGYGTVYRQAQAPQPDPELIQNPKTGVLE